MLLTKEVEVVVNKKNITWYNSKGYECDLRDIISVNVSDLIPNTHTKIQYQCDKCGDIKEINYSDFHNHHTKDRTFCKECANEIRINNYSVKYLAKDGFKLCKKCNRVLPADTDHFYKKNSTRDGFMLQCKECEGSHFTDRLTNKSKDNYKFCIKCKREFPIDIKYFPPDKICKDGFRNVCRECGKDGHFMGDDYVPKQWWDKEKEQLLIDNYSKYTNSELIELFFPNETHKSLWDKAWKMGISGKDEDAVNRLNIEKSEKMSGENSPLYGVHMSEETKKKLSDSKKGKYVGINNALFNVKWDKNDKRRYLTSQRTKGKWAGNKNPRVANPLRGKDNPNWKGGKTQLYFELRSEIKEWQQLSMENCHYKCVLTNGEFDNIHHLYPFKKIVNEVFESLKLDQRTSVSDYSEEEFNSIKIKLHELHDIYGLGVCLKKDIHKLFHDLYGYKNNTQEQFYEFEKRYYNFEFDDLLEDKYKYENVIKKVS